MKLIVENIFLYEHLEIDLEPGPTLVTGVHSSGKSSVAKIVAALGAHDANPNGVDASSAKTYVRDGALEGSARMGDIVWSPPAGLTIPPGVGPTAPRHAVGLVDFLRGRDKKGRTAIWEGLFLPKDPDAILRPMWTLEARQYEAVIKEIKKPDGGWDKAQNIYEGQRTAARRTWEGITGARWGPRKAVQWRPDDWETDLEGMSEDDVTTALTEANDALRALGAQQAVAQERVDRGTHARDVLIPELQARIDEAQARIDSREDVAKPLRDAYETLKADVAGREAKLRKMKREGEDMKAAIVALNEHVPPAAIPCPHCGVALMIREGEIVDHADLGAGEREARKAKLTEEFTALGKEYKPLAETLKEKTIALAAAEANLNAEQKEIGSAKASLASLEGEMRVHRTTAKDAALAVNPGVDEAERSRLENERDRAQRRLKAWRDMQGANKARENYVELDTIVKLLGPEGARAQHMKGHMDQIRKVLANINGFSGWKPIGITQQYEVTSGNRPVQLVAANEQLKAQWVVQAAVAMLTKGTRWLILDAAELRDDSYLGLFVLAERVAKARPAMHILVCMTEAEAPEGWATIRVGAAA